jgi:hypothetical protein
LVILILASERARNVLQGFALGIDSEPDLY